jgi:hypothetical protein
MRVSTAEFLENYQAVFDRALSEPGNGERPRPASGDPRRGICAAEAPATAVAVEELTEAEIEAILKAEVLAESAYLLEDIPDVGHVARSSAA